MGGADFFNGNLTPGHFSKWFFSLCPPPCDAGSNDTDYKSVWCSGAESMKGHTQIE